MAKLKHNKRYLEEITTALMPLKEYFLTNQAQYLERFELLRSVYHPYDDSSMFSHADFDYNNYDPRSYLTPLRATSGFMSYHYNPSDKFFDLKKVEYSSVKKKDQGVELHQILANRTEDLHTVIQTPRNYLVQTKNMWDKLVFGLSGKTIDTDKSEIALFTHYAPEQLAIGSSNGLNSDIYGVKEMLSAFQLKMRFPDPITEMEDMPVIMSQMKGDIEVYRINIPKVVLRAHLESMFTNNMGMEKKFMDYWKNIFKISANKRKVEAVPWLDILFTDRGLLTVNERAYRNIIVSPFALGCTNMSLGKGIGEIALPRALGLTELEAINLVAYSRTYRPAWAIHEETQALGLDLGEDGITVFASDGSRDNVPRHLSLGANIQGMIEYKTVMESHFDQAFMLDIFELAHKSRMTKTETNIRDSEDLRKAGLYVTLDEQHDLRPSILAVNYMMHEQLSIKDKSTVSAKEAINARFIGPLAASHRTNVLNVQGQMVQYLQQIEAIAEKRGPTTDVVNLMHQVKQVYIKMGQSDNLYTEEEQEENAYNKQEMKKLEMDEMKSRALGNLPRPEAQGPPQGGQPLKPAGNLA